MVKFGVNVTADTGCPKNGQISVIINAAQTAIDINLLRDAVIIKNLPLSVYRNTYTYYIKFPLKMEVFLQIFLFF